MFYSRGVLTALKSKVKVLIFFPLRWLFCYVWMDVTLEQAVTPGAEVKTIIAQEARSGDVVAKTGSEWLDPSSKPHSAASAAAYPPRYSHT